MVNRENDAVRKIFKMFSIVQMMFIKEVPGNFNSIRILHESAPMLNDTINLLIKNKYNRWQPPFALLKDIL